MDDALYRFFTARVGLRFLTEHHVLSSTNTQSANALWNVISMFPEDRNNHNMRGVIQPNVDVAEEVHKVADIVKRQTAEYYQGLCPQIDIVDCKKSPVSDGEFTHVPHHLHYMFYELLKNSCRASIRKYHAQMQLHLQQQQPQAGTLNKVHSYLSASTKSSSEPQIPPIRVIIVMGAEDVTIKVADRGGGIPRSLMNTTIWQFAHSTAAVDELDTAFGQDGLTGAKIRGFGLPLARIYARYFGGELTLKSTEGYGLDAYLHIPRLGNCCENLPLRVRDSPGEHDSIPNFTTVLK
jgi:pyruvate dehydrogenase kinase 2/3/4